MKNQYSKILLFLVILLAAFLRIYQLGINPPSLDWDEASLAYNAYSILKTGKDEFGRPWPISIRSFEDYKPAVYTYLTIPTVALFGLTEIAVRLPSAAFGLLTVVVAYFLVKELFSRKVAILTSMLLAISPWHLQFSRVAFEANVSLFFVVSGAFFFLRGFKNGKWWILSAFLFVISFYTYHSSRLVVPLLLLGWSVYFREELFQKRNWLGISLLVGILLLIPFIQELTGSARARFGSVTVLNAEERLTDSIPRIEYDQKRGDWVGRLLHNRRIVYALATVKGYLDHFNLDFLFLTGDAPDRHHARDMGMLYLWEALTIPIGILVLLKTRGSLPVFWWFLVAPSAAALTTGTPHAVRALLYLPTYQIFSAVGLIMLLGKLRRIGEKNFSRRFLILSFFAAVIANGYFYFESYYMHTPIEAAKDWQYGFKQAVDISKQYESEVDKIVFTYRYDQPHVYVLFYNQIDPAWYQKQLLQSEVKRFERNFGKYEFRNIAWSEDQKLTSTLFIGTPGEIPDAVPGQITDIYFPDGSVAFRVVKR